jgi:putative transposase
MPRKHFIAVKHLPYHAEARSNNRDWFSIPLNMVWEIFTDYLCFISRVYNVRVHAFVLMQNHFHLIATTPQGSLSEAMNYFMRETSRVIGYESQRINHVYGGPYWWSILSSELYFAHCFKYVFRNPVAAGVVAEVQDYKFSSLSGQYGLSQLQFPIYESSISTLIPKDDKELISWLNQDPSGQASAQIAKALRLSYFAFSKERTTRHACELENKLV